MTTAESKAANDSDKKRKRAERFGIVRRTASNGLFTNVTLPPSQPSNNADNEKKAARAERFKDPAAAAEEAKRKERAERFKDPAVKANEEKLKQRAERFAAAAASS